MIYYLLLDDFGTEYGEVETKEDVPKSAKVFETYKELEAVAEEALAIIEEKGLLPIDEEAEKINKEEANLIMNNPLSNRNKEKNKKEEK